MNKEERLLALIKAHEHVSEAIGSYRRGLSVTERKSEEHLKGMQKSRDQLRNTLIDTALEEE